tara:strand:+ start:352 stop:516 length:165 start_codon:yes stop_codon:yes gene_type:complete
VPQLVLWLAVGGLAYLGVKQVGDTADQASNLAKWGLLAGAGYAGFLAAKKAKLI